MEFDENSKNCHLSQEGSEQEFVTILLPIGEEIWRYSENSDGWSNPDYRQIVYTNRKSWVGTFFTSWNQIKFCKKYVKIWKNTHK